MTYTFGLDTFGDRESDADGRPLSHAQTIRNVAEEGVLAEQAGVDFFGIGEASFEAETGPGGALYVGSPETVARKIATNLRALDATRFDLKYGVPGLTHAQLMTAIDLYGREVIPRVRDLLA